MSKKTYSVDSEDESEYESDSDSENESDNVIDMNYKERVDLLNENKNKLNNLLSTSKYYIIEVIILLVIFYILTSPYIQYIPQLPIGRFISTSNMLFPTTETYQSFFERSLTLILIFIIIKKII